MNFSVIIPVYNSYTYLEECILSILQQTHQDFELIIIDGGSTDGTLDIINKYQNKLTYWYSGRDSGQSEAINHGLKKASGDIISWLNADERYFPETLKTVNDTLQKQDIELVFGCTRMVNEAQSKHFLKKPTSFNPKVLTLWYGESLPTDSLFWKKSLQDRIGLLNEKEYPRISMDVDWTLRLSTNTKGWFFIDLPLSTRIDRMDASTNSSPKSAIAKNRGKILENYLVERFRLNQYIAKLIGYFGAKITRRLSIRWIFNNIQLNRLHKS